jgi:hypothetical protein
MGGTGTTTRSALLELKGAMPIERGPSSTLTVEEFIRRGLGGNKRLTQFLPPIGQSENPKSDCRVA